MDVYEKLKELKINLPAVPPKGGIYKPVKQINNILYVSGQGATRNGKPVITGKMGKDRTIEEGQEASRICTLNALSCLQEYLIDLNKIKSVVKILAFVASASGFNSQPEVVNGSSELLAAIWGSENGIGARSAISTNELPGNVTVEIEFMFEV